MIALERAPSTARFQRSGGGAVVYGGLYLPSLQNGLSGRFENQPLESAYQRYSHRQRQKSFIVVNGVDVALKIIAVILISFHYNSSAMISSTPCSIDLTASVNSSSDCNSRPSPSGAGMVHSHGAYPTETVTWTSCLILVNVLLCLLAFCWKCFANNYLHWAALATWLLMNLQGEFNSQFKHNPTSFLINCGLNGRQPINLTSKLLRLASTVYNTEVGCCKKN